MARVLIIAGSDPSGGAGIQADIKTVTALGGYAATAITALTIQNTQAVTGVHPVPVEVIQAQAEAVLEDIGADIIKTGMIYDAAVIHMVCDLMGGPAQGIPLLVDPVMVATQGASLQQDDAKEAMIERLIPKAMLLTPNLPEAAALTGLKINEAKDMERAGRALLARGAQAVLLKGGHAEGDIVTDILVSADMSIRFESPRIRSRHTHGTGCTLASAIATGLAQNMPLETAVRRARDYVWRAINTAPGLGSGHGPLNHGFPCRLPPE